MLSAGESQDGVRACNYEVCGYSYGSVVDPSDLGRNIHFPGFQVLRKPTYSSRDDKIWIFGFIGLAFNTKPVET